MYAFRIKQMNILCEELTLIRKYFPSVIESLLDNCHSIGPSLGWYKKFYIFDANHVLSRLVYAFLAP